MSEATSGISGGPCQVPHFAEPVIGRRFAPTRWLMRATEIASSAMLDSCCSGNSRSDQMARRPGDPRHAAEAAFKAATTKPPEPMPKAPSIPGAKEMVSLRIDCDVLEY